MMWNFKGLISVLWISLSWRSFACESHESTLTTKQIWGWSPSEEEVKEVSSSNHFNFNLFLSNFLGFNSSNLGRFIFCIRKPSIISFTAFNAQQNESIERSQCTSPMHFMWPECSIVQVALTISSLSASEHMFSSRKRLKTTSRNECRNGEKLIF